MMPSVTPTIVVSLLLAAVCLGAGSGAHAASAGSHQCVLKLEEALSDLEVPLEVEQMERVARAAAPAHPERPLEELVRPEEFSHDDKLVDACFRFVMRLVEAFEETKCGLRATMFADHLDETDLYRNLAEPDSRLARSISLAKACVVV